MTSPLPSNLGMCTLRGRYGVWTSVPGFAAPQFQPFVGLRILLSPPYPFVTDVTATPSPLVTATAPREFITDSEGYMSDPRASNSRNCLVVGSDDPDMYPTDWKYLVTFAGVGATNFRAFRTPCPVGQIVDMAVLTPQRLAPTSAPTAAEAAAAQAAASAAAALQAVASIQRGVAGGVAALDADGDVNNAAGVKVLPGGGGGTVQPSLSNIQGMSDLAKLFNAEFTQLAMRNRIGAGVGNSNLQIGVSSGTAADAAITNTAIGLRAVDTTVVHRTNDEFISGVKTFANPPVVPSAVASDQAVNKGQLDAAISTVGGGGGGTDPNAVHRTGDEAISGIKTFTAPPVVPTATAAGNPATKAQLDSAVATINTGRVATVPSTADVTVSVAYVLATTNPNASRPALPSYGKGLWDYAGSTPPVNMVDGDIWLGA